MALLCWALQPAVAADAAARFRFQAPVEVVQPAAYLQLPLPPAAYAHSLQPGLADLRLVDARGERVPFALLAPRADETRSTEQQHDAVLYPLPARPKPGAAWASPVEVRIEGERIHVKRLGSAASDDPKRSAGWLLDLGERQPQDPAPRSLRLQWSGPAEFSAAFAFETSDDLRAWRPGGQGQVMALASAGSPLTQPVVMLPDGAGRFVRLVWSDLAAAPALSGAHVITEQQHKVALEAPTEIVLAPGAAPADQAASVDGAARALHFDLGGVLPLQQIDLRLAAGTRVAPVRIDGRVRAEDPWQSLAGAVFYRLEREAGASVSPALALHAEVRYLRVVPDTRAAALDATQTRLVVQARLASLVFVAQGQAPFTLLAGSAQAERSALPVGTLVAELDVERPRFGRATLGAWSEVAEVAREAAAQQRVAAMRPWLLWGVLLAGVAGLGVMVWRLARGRPPA